MSRTRDLSRLFFESDGAWIRDRNGAVWAYRPDVGTFGLHVEQRWTVRFGYEGTALFEMLGELGYTLERMDEWRVEPSTGDIERDLLLSSNFVFRPSAD